MEQMYWCNQIDGRVFISDPDGDIFKCSRTCQGCDHIVRKTGTSSHGDTVAYVQPVRTTGVVQVNPAEVPGLNYHTATSYMGGSGRVNL